MANGRPVIEEPKNVSFDIQGLPLAQAQAVRPMGLVGLPSGAPVTLPGMGAPRQPAGWLEGLGTLLQGLGSGWAGQPDPAIERRKAQQVEQAMAMQQQQMGLQQQQAGLAERRFGLDVFTKMVPLMKDFVATEPDKDTLRKFLGFFGGLIGPTMGIPSAALESTMDQWITDREGLKQVLGDEIERLAAGDPGKARQYMREALSDRAAYKETRGRRMLELATQERDRRIQKGEDPFEAASAAGAQWPEVAEQIRKSVPDPGQFVEYKTLPTGQRSVYYKRTGKEEILGEPMKTAQPLTDTYVAAVASGSIKDPTLTPEAAKAIQTEREASLGRVSGARAGERIGAEYENREKLAETARLKAFNTQLGGAQAALTDVGQRRRFQDAYNAKVGQLDAELSQGPTGEPRVTATTAARMAGQALPAELSQQVGGLRVAQATIRKFDEFNDKEINEWVMRISLTGAGKFQTAMTEMVSGMDEKAKDRFFRFLALNEQLRGSAFTEGGKQLTPFEASVVFGYTPHGREFSGRLWTIKRTELEERNRLRIEMLTETARTPRGRSGELPSVAPPLPGRVPAPGKPPRMILRDGRWVPE